MSSRSDRPAPGARVNTDPFVWNGGATGDWGTASNWIDTTTGVAASAPPGATNAVTVNGSFGNYIDITGTGASASLTLNAFTKLAGQFTTGVLAVALYDSLTLDAGATLGVAGNAVFAGVDFVDLSGPGAALSVGGTLALGPADNGSSQILISGGAAVDTAALSTPGSFNLSIDAASSMEVGTAGNVQAGTFKIDHGETVALSGTVSVPTLALNGVLSAGTLTLDATSLAGTGTIDIGGTLSLSNYSGPESGGASLTVDFTGAAAALDLSQDAVDSANRFEPVIAGFTAGDQIDWGGTLTGASYANGVLTLSNGSLAVATLTLSGNFAGQSFVAAPSGYSSSEVVLVGAGDTRAPPPGTTTPDNYVWNAGVSGSWDRAADWTDSSTGATPAAVAPGVNDAVTIGSLYSQDGTVVISGKGNASALTLNGPTLFDGVFSAAILNDQAPDQALLLNAGSRLTVTGAAQFSQQSTISVSGAGAHFAVGALDVGTSSFGFSDGAIAVTDGGALTATQFQCYEYATITIDATSSLAVGTAGRAAAGSMTIDGGAIAFESGQLNAPTLVVDGTLDAGTLQLNAAAIGGHGTVEIQGTLSFATAPNWASGLALDFASGGTLDLTASPFNSAGHFAPVIGDFTEGDVITWQNVSLTGASFSAGTLSLIASTGTVATLSLTGSYGNQTFLVLPPASDSSEVVVVGAGDTRAPPAGTTTPDSYAWRGSANASWDVAANWDDVSTGENPAAVAPGVHDSVLLGALSPYGPVSVVSGKGNAATLTIEGSYLLAGTFSATTFVFGGFSGAGLYLDASDRLSVSGTASSQDGAYVTVNGAGASFAVAGLCTLGIAQQLGNDSGLGASNGGVIQLGGLVDYLPLTLNADQTSSIEIGSAGHATSGAVTVDAGQSLAIAGTIDAPALILNGTLVANGLSIDANTLGATGTIEIGSTLSIGSVLYGTLTGGAGVTVAFTGVDQTLQLGQQSLDAAGRFEPTITGFGVADTLAWSGTVTSTSFSAGTLTLLEGTSTVATLNVAGDYQGLSFVAVANSYLTDILSVGAGDTNTAPAGTVTPNDYVLNNQVDASWDVAANWTDATKGADPAAVAPGRNDSVTLALPGQYYLSPEVVTGTGKAAALTISGPAVLDGSFTADTLTIDSDEGTAVLYAHTSLLVTGNATLNSILDLGVGSTFTTNGTLTVNAVFDPLALAGGGYASAGALALDSGSIAIDATSAFEIGTRGHAAAGSFHVAAGAFAAAQGQITAPSIVVDGTLDANGLILAVDSLHGTGTIAIENTLAFYSDATSTISGGAGLSVMFDVGNTLYLSPMDLGAGTFLPTITDFGVDDTIIWAGDLTSATDSHGKLTLFDGTAKVGTLTLAGSYAGETFVTQQTGYGETDISVVADTASAFAPPAPHSQPQAHPTATGLGLDQQISWRDQPTFGASWSAVHPYCP